MYTYRPDSGGNVDSAPISPGHSLKKPPLPPPKPPKPQRQPSYDNKPEELSPLTPDADPHNMELQIVNEKQKPQPSVNPNWDKGPANRDIHGQRDSKPEIDLMSSMRTFQGRMYKRIMLLTFISLVAIAIALAALILLLKGNIGTTQPQKAAYFQAGLPTKTTKLCVEKGAVVSFTTAWILEGFEMPYAGKFSCPRDGYYMFGMSVQVENMEANAELNMYRKSEQNEEEIVCRMTAGKQWGTSDNTKICYTRCRKSDLIYARSWKRDSCLYGNCEGERCLCTMFGQYIGELPPPEEN